MKALLDTHSTLWLLEDNPRLGVQARRGLMEPGAEVWASLASLWEVAIKHRAAKLLADSGRVRRGLTNSNVRLLDIRAEHLARLELLRPVRDHRDPFDHLLVSQALAEGLDPVSDDSWMRHYPVRLIPASR